MDRIWCPYRLKTRCFFTKNQAFRPRNVSFLWESTWIEHENRRKNELVSWCRRKSGLNKYTHQKCKKCSHSLLFSRISCGKRYINNGNKTEIIRKKRKLFVKPDDQSQTCLNCSMARKRRMKSNILCSILFCKFWKISWCEQKEKVGFPCFPFYFRIFPL